MTTRRALQIVVVSTAVLTASTTCRETPVEKDDLAELEAMEEAVRELIAAGSCSDSSDCGTIALGAKPCGGPWGYLVYSRSEVDTSRLAEKARAYTEFNRVLNERWGYISDCALQPEPEPVCRDGRCVDQLALYDKGIAP